MPRMIEAEVPLRRPKPYVHRVRNKRERNLPLTDLRRVYLITAVAAAFILFASFVPLAAQSNWHSCPPNPFGVICSPDTRYVSLTFLFFGFGGVYSSAYYFSFEG
jgi:hypothetical protein